MKLWSTSTICHLICGPRNSTSCGLAAALRWYATRYTMRSGITAEVIGDSAIGVLPHEVETACFRITQEALANTARHSRATKATVRLERRKGQLHLAVHDNGIGFNSRKLLDGTTSARVPGLRGMQERALAIRAQIEINLVPVRAPTSFLTCPWFSGTNGRQHSPNLTVTEDFRARDDTSRCCTVRY